MTLSERQIQLIKTLADGKCHSGQHLGGLLGVSRAAVWKHLQSLQQLGLEVRSQAGRGYCLAQPLSLLEDASIFELLAPAVRQWLRSIHCFYSLGSTNSWLLQRAGVESIAGVLVLAEQQTAGRGRRGRSWISPFGCNLYCSLGWQFEQGVAALEGLSLAVGVVLVEALASLGVRDLALKWPNDLLLRGRKLGGILLEIGGDLSGQCHLVLGVGLNVRMPASQAPTIDQPWSDLAELSATISRNQLVARLLESLLPLMATYEHSGFAAYRERWERLNAYRDVEIHVLREGASVLGVCRGVTDKGALCVESEGRLIQLQGGEISVRKAT